MAESRMYNKRAGITSESIGRSVQSFLRMNKGLVVQGGKAGQGYVVQAREESNWKKISGMDMATEVQISEAGECFLVNIGNAKWADKVGAGIISWFVFAPLAVTSVVGTVKQKKLPGEIFEHIERFIMSGGVDMYAGMDFANCSTGMVTCPHCKAEVPSGQAFCNSCGGALTEKCPICGEKAMYGTRFCPSCGSNMHAVKTKKCPVCGEEMVEDCLFCMKCGNPMKENTVEKTGWTCEKCGEKNEADDNFCSKCGGKHVDIEKQNPTYNECPNCKASVASGKKFCPKCGHEMVIYL